MTLKYEAPASHSFKGPLQLQGYLQVLPISAQLMFPLLHQSLINRSPWPNPKLSPPLIAYFLNSSLRGKIVLQSKENRNDWMFLCSIEYSSQYLGNIMLEQPPNLLFLQDYTQRTIGPLIFKSYILLERKLFLEAVNFSFNSQSLNGKIALIWSSFRLILNSYIFSLRIELKSISTSCLLIILLIFFYLENKLFQIQAQIFQGMHSLYSQIIGMQSAFFLYIFQISRNCRQQYFASMFENKLFLSSQNILSRQSTIVALQRSKLFYKFSLSLMCFSIFVTHYLQSSYPLTLCSECLNQHFQFLQMNLLPLQRESQHTLTTSSPCYLHFWYVLPNLNKQFISLQIILRMGNQCCADNNLPKAQLEKIQAQILVPISNSDYYQHSFPLDEAVQLKLNYLQDQQEYKQLFEKHKVMKHKFLDKYYVGEWSNKGFPQGRGIMLEPEKYLYYGEFSKIPNGFGVVELFQQQIKYEGEIKDGKAEGKGKITSKDDRYTFEGVMNNSIPKSGKVVLKNHHDESKSHTIILDDFPNNKSEILYGDGRRYLGFINKRSFTPQGEGTALFPDNSKYEGQWEEGEMHGYGEFSWNDGSSYKGQYQHGRKHGEGTFVFVSKKYYQGEWTHGKQNGKGTLFDKNGAIIHRGIWNNGLFVKQSD